MHVHHPDSGDVHALHEPMPVGDAVWVEDDHTQPTPTPATGNERLDAALRDVANLSGVDVSEHAARFEAAHDVMRDILNTSAEGTF